MNSYELSRMVKACVLVSWLDLIPGVIGYFLNNQSVVLISFIVALIFASVALIFYFFYVKACRKEDEVILEEFSNYIAKHNKEKENK